MAGLLLRLAQSRVAKSERFETAESRAARDSCVLETMWPSAAEVRRQMSDRAAPLEGFPTLATVL